MITKLNISPKAFWDIDYNKLKQQADNYSEYIIRKVFEFGTFDDILNVVSYFGKEKVIDTLIKSHFLLEKCLHFSLAMF